MALALFVEALQRRAELQTIALEDIANRFQALQRLGEEPQPDDAGPGDRRRDRSVRSSAATPEAAGAKNTASVVRATEAGSSVRSDNLAGHKEAALTIGAQLKWP